MKENSDKIEGSTFYIFAEYNKISRLQIDTDHLPWNDDLQKYLFLNCNSSHTTIFDATFTFPSSSFYVSQTKCHTKRIHTWILFWVIFIWVMSMCFYIYIHCRACVPITHNVIYVSQSTRFTCAFYIWEWWF